MLSIGSSGSEVRQLQAGLNLLPLTNLARLAEDGIFGIRTAGRVREFQGFSNLAIDGIVGNFTFAALQLALSLLNQPVPPPAPVNPITVAQKNPASLTTAHTVSNPFVLPPLLTTPLFSFRFSEHSTPATIQEFLFEIRKGGRIFWIGAAVPPSTVDFTAAQVFFHPTVVQDGEIRARDEDYDEFKGDWSTATTTSGSSIQRYVPLQGGQLAHSGLKVPLLVPFTTMRALSSKGGKLTPDNMFADRPAETLAAVLHQLEQLVLGTAPRLSPLTISKLGVTSFSSGIGAMNLFVNSFFGSGLLKEVIDLDGTAIVGVPKALPGKPFGAKARCFAHAVPDTPHPNYVLVNRAHFSAVTAFGHFPEGPKLDVRIHARIGFMMYCQAMMTSALK